MIYFTKPSGRVKQANPVFAPPRASNWLASLAVIGLFASPAYGQQSGVTSPSNCAEDTVGVGEDATAGVNPAASGDRSVAQGCNADAAATASIAIGSGATTANYEVPGEELPPAVQGTLMHAGSIGGTDYTTPQDVIIETDAEGRTTVYLSTDTDRSDAIDLTNAMGDPLPFTLTRTVTPVAAVDGTGGAGAISFGTNARTIGTGSISIGAGARVLSVSTAAQLETPPDAVEGTLRHAGEIGGVDYTVALPVIVETATDGSTVVYAAADTDRRTPLNLNDENGVPLPFTLTRTVTPAQVPPASLPRTLAVEGAVAIGAGASVTHLEDAEGNAILDADGASTPAHRGVAIGNNAKVTGENGIAIGANAEAGANEIRIGTNQSEVFIGPYDLGQISDDVETNRAGIATAVALSSLPSVQGPDGGWSLALGAFDGETAVAGGINFDFRQIGTIKIGVATSGGETSAGVGFGMGF